MNMEMERSFHERTHRHFSKWHWSGWILLGIIACAVFLGVAGYIIMSLWNWLMPPLFKLSVLTFWQAVGIAILARLIFGNSHRGWSHWRRKRWAHMNSPYYHRQFAHSHWNMHHRSGCECDTPKWQYYDKFWSEEGEKAFEEFAKKQSEKSDSNS